MDKDVKEIAEILFENDVNITNNKMTLEDAERLYPEDVEDIYYKPAKAILKAGYIQLASLNEDMKIIGDEEIESKLNEVYDGETYAQYVEQLGINIQDAINLVRFGTEHQLAADRLTRDKKREELEAILEDADEILPQSLPDMVEEIIPLLCGKDNRHCVMHHCCPVGVDPKDCTTVQLAQEILSKLSPKLAELEGEIEQMKKELWEAQSQLSAKFSMLVAAEGEKMLAVRQAKQEERERIRTALSKEACKDSGEYETGEGFKCYKVFFFTRTVWDKFWQALQDNTK